MRKSLLLCLLLFILVAQRPVLADNYEVLGIATPSATVLPQLPPTPEGPGLILPDSPFYFLDNFKQNVRLFFAFDPIAKAKVYESIAGERLAELRFMLNANNISAANVALDGVSQNLQGAANQISKAKFSGEDVSAVAQTINNDIKAKQQTLDFLEANSSGELKTEVQKAQDSILISKAEVENGLPSDLLQNEINYDLNRKVKNSVENASESAKLLKKDIEELNKQTLEASKEALANRQEALKAAIESKNQKLVETEAKLLEIEKQKQQGILQAQSKAAAQAQDALEKAQEAAQKYQEAQKALLELRDQSDQGLAPTATSTPTNTPVTNTQGSNFTR